MSLTTTSAILLRSHSYSETSQILRFYAEDLGTVSVMARGSRRAGGRRGSPPASFSQGALSLYFRANRELQTFRGFEPSIDRRGLALDPVRLSAASVLGELVLQHAGSDRHPSLYHTLARGLDAAERCQANRIVAALLTHLWSIVRELGYAPLLAACIECGRALQDQEMARFDLAAGGLRCSGCLEGGEGPRVGPNARKQLGALILGNFDGELLRPRAQLRLASDFVTYHISAGTPLRAMDVLFTLLWESRA